MPGDHWKLWRDRLQMCVIKGLIPARLRFRAGLVVEGRCLWYICREKIVQSGELLQFEFKDSRS